MRLLHALTGRPRCIALVLAEERKIIIAEVPRRLVIRHTLWMLHVNTMAGKTIKIMYRSIPSAVRTSRDDAPSFHGCQSIFTMRDEPDTA